MKIGGKKSPHYNKGRHDKKRHSKGHHGKKRHSKGHHGKKRATKKTKRSQFKKVSCSPGKLTRKTYHTCYNNSALINMRRLWNVRHPDDKIHSDNPRNIWREMRDKMAHVCESEKCWLNQQFMSNNISEELRTYTFAPSMPYKWKSNMNEWLTSTDLTQAMRHIEHAHKDFVFLGPSPIDFDLVKDGECIWPELCNFDLHKLRQKGKRKIGMIFNLDPHFKGGSHWVSVFVDCERKFILFFDSNGDPAPKEIIKLAERIKAQGNAINLDLEFRENAPMEHQYKNTECGIYSIYYIKSMVDGAHYNKFTEKGERIPDENMEELRKIYFSEL